MKRFLALACALVLALGILGGCSASSKEFDTEAGMTITLPGSFNKKDMEGQTAYFESPTAIVTALKETFDELSAAGLDLSADSTVDEYGQIIIEGNGLSGSLEDKDGVKCFKYEQTVSGTDFSYLGTVTKGPDAFWLVQFACETKNYDKFESDFIKWAKSMKFAE